MKKNADGVYIIAEAGVNHNGDPELAEQLVRAAHQAGANAVKFQTFKAEALATQKAEKANYQKANSAANESQLDMLRSLELGVDDHKKLFKLCRDIGIDFMSSPFDEESADFLADLGVKRIKVPSGEITNFPYLRHIARLGLPVILSTGMSFLGEVEEALEVMTANGLGLEDITLLHCTSEYPAPYQEVNLAAMKTMAQAFGVPVGYSDHTNGLEITFAAVALGAVVIEKHFTLDQNLPGPDHKASIEPDQLAELVRGVRHCSAALGDGRKKPTKSEELNRKLVRKSIVAATGIAVGEELTAEKLTTKRPGTGISPTQFDVLIGCKATRNYKKNDMI
jgi:N,N'-diacetyllegionaminate synthase